MKRVKDGIYAYSCEGELNKLVFRRAVLNGKLYIAYVKQGKLIALRRWDEIQKEMHTGAPCLNLEVYGTRVSIAN